MTSIACVCRFFLGYHVTACILRQTLPKKSASWNPNHVVPFVSIAGGISPFLLTARMSYIRPVFTTLAVLVLVDNWNRVGDFVK